MLLRGRNEKGWEVHILVAVMVNICSWGKRESVPRDLACPPSLPLSLTPYGPSTVGSYGEGGNRKRLHFAHASILFLLGT